MSSFKMLYVKKELECSNEAVVQEANTYWNWTQFPLSITSLMVGRLLRQLHNTF